MQEDKEMYFDALNTTTGCLQLLSDMLKSTTFNKDKMKNQLLVVLQMQLMLLTI